MRRYGGRPGRPVRGRVSAGLGCVLGLLLTAALTSGCLFWRERICPEGEYPVKQVGSATGRTCVPDGQEPPEGYVRYPAGKVPEYRFDEWDERWKDTVFDENGNIVRD